VLKDWAGFWSEAINQVIFGLEVGPFEEEVVLAKIVQRIEFSLAP